MQRLILFLALCATQAVAGLITFETLPNANIVCGGASNIGSFYAGQGVATFGSDVEGLSSGLGCGGGSGFPPHSGIVNVVSVGGDFAMIAFTSLASSVSVWYISLDTITLSAFDSGSNLLGSANGAANTDGSTGSDSLLSVSFPQIAFVTLGFTGGQDGFAFDDLSFTPQANATPEPATWVLTALGCIALLHRGRRREIPSRHSSR